MFFYCQEESTSLQVTGKGGNQSQMEVFWTKDDVSSIDMVIQ